MQWQKAELQGYGFAPGNAKYGSEWSENWFH